MDVEAGLTCPQCSAARDIYRYCMNCGFDYDTLGDDNEPPVLPVISSTNAIETPTGDFTAEPEGVLEADTAERPGINIQPVLPPQASSEPSHLVGGRSAPALLALIVAGVFVLILIVATAVSLIGADGDTSDATDPQSSGTASADDSPTPDGTKPTCWDGTEVAALADCSEPVGSEGLAWVFPSFDQQECNEQRSEPAKWTCSVETADGGDVQIRYREHKSVRGALAAYSAKYGSKNRTPVLSAREDVERYVWRAPNAKNNGVWALSSMYAEHPWSVTIRGLSADDVETALNDNVQFRNPRRLDGSPADG